MPRRVRRRVAIVLAFAGRHFDAPGNGPNWRRNLDGGGTTLAAVRWAGPIVAEKTFAGRPSSAVRPVLQPYPGHRNGNAHSQRLGFPSEQPTCTQR